MITFEPLFTLFSLSTSLPSLNSTNTHQRRSRVLGGPVRSLLSRERIPARWSANCYIFYHSLHFSRDVCIQWRKSTAILLYWPWVSATRCCRIRQFFYLHFFRDKLANYNCPGGDADVSGQKGRIEITVCLSSHTVLRREKTQKPTEISRPTLISQNIQSVFNESSLCFLWAKVKVWSRVQRSEMESTHTDRQQNWARIIWFT